MRSVFLVFSALSISFGWAQSPNSVEFRLQQLSSVDRGPQPGSTLVAIGYQLLGTPYQAGTLEQPGKEQLLIRLDALDCWTFVEQTVALTLLNENIETVSLPKFKEQVQKLRYRNGKLNGYGSRIHYFTEWLIQAANNGYLRDITQELGGIPDPRKINFMSANVQKYPSLQDQEAYETVQAAEAFLNLQTKYFIPKARVRSIENQLQEGDIIAITTSIKGLDVSHEGIAVRKNGRIYLLHASSDHKKVMLTQEPLSDYLAQKSNQTGILVARLN